MAMTLVEASKYSDSPLNKGIVQTFVYEDPILARLPFMEVVGNAHKYNRETTADTAAWKAVNEAWAPTEQVITAYTAVLKILGSTAQVDDFLRSTRSNINDLRAEQLEGKAKAMKKEFMETFYYGVASTEPKAFDGLHTLISNTTYNTVQVDGSDASNIPLSCLVLDQAIDMIKDPYKADMIISSKNMRRRVTKYLRGLGSIEQDRDEWSRPLPTYNGIKWYVSDYILDTENTSSGAWAAGTDDTTSIFILSFGNKGLTGIQNRAMEVVPWIQVPGTNVEEARIRWYCSIMLESLVSCAKVVGIDADGTVAA